MCHYLQMIPQLLATSISQIKILSQKMQMITTFLVHQNNLAFIHEANTHTETLSANQIYSITILTIKTCSHLQTNIQHYYNKNYKIHIGIYTTQKQLKAIKSQKIWTLRLCHMQCILPAIQIQSQRSITYHIKQQWHVYCQINK